MAKKFLNTVVIVLCSLPAWTIQNPDCDRLYHELHYIHAYFSNNATIEKIDSLTSLLDDTCAKGHIVSNLLYGRYYKSLKDFAKTDSFYRQSLSFAEQSDNHFWQKEVLSSLAIATLQNGDSPKGLALFNQAIDIVCRDSIENCRQANIKLLINKGVLMMSNEQYEESLELLLHADSLILEKQPVLRDSLRRVSIYNTLGRIMNMQEFYDKAIAYYNVALENSPINYARRFGIYNNLCQVYASKKDYANADLYFNKTINESQNTRDYIVAYQIMSDAASNQDSDKLAIEYAEKALQYAIDNNKRTNQATTLGMLGQLSYKMKEYGVADDYFQQFFALSENTKSKNYTEIQRYDILNALSTSNYAPLKERMERFLENIDTLHSIQKEQAIVTLTNNFDKRVLRDSLLILDLENQQATNMVKTRNWSIFGLSLLIGMLGLAVWLYRSFFTSQKELNKALLRENILIEENKKRLELEKEELVFQKSELEQVNSELQRKNKHLNISSPQEDLVIEIIKKSKTHLIQTSRIRYVETLDRGCQFYLSDGTSIWDDNSLKHWTTILPSDTFPRIHKSYLVNRIFISWINYSKLSLKDGQELPIGRVYKSNLT